MNITKLCSLFAACLLVLNTMACGGGGSSVSGEWFAVDQGQKNSDDNSVSEAPVVGPEVDVLKPVIGKPAFHEVLYTKLADHRYDWSPDPTPGHFSQGYFAWSGGTFDTTRNRLLIFGGGHGDYGGQEIYAFDIETLTWSIVAEPEEYSALDPNCDNTEYPLRTLNNFPKSQHSYDYVEYLAPLDSLVFTSGGVGYGNCFGGTELARYSFVADQWTFEDDPKLSGGTGAASAVDPSTDIWWIVGSNGHLTTYNPHTGEWKRGPYDNLMSLDSNKKAVIDSARNLFILFHGGYNGQGRGVYTFPLNEDVETYTPSLQTSQKTITGVEPRYGRAGIAYDPVSGKIIAWDGGNTVFLLDTEIWEWTTAEASGVTMPADTNSTGTFGRFQYVESLDKFILVNTVSQNVFFLDLRPNEVTTSFDLTSAVAGDVPFTTAVGFKGGDVPDTPVLDLDNYQVEVKRRWSDGSVKHAVFSGVYPSVTDQSFTVQVFDSGDVPTGTDLTEADIVTAAPTAMVDLGSYGSVSLTDLLGTPERIWLQGPEIIEAHYSADVGTDDALVVKFYVRLYVGGQLYVRAVVENGILDGVNETKTYTPTVTIGGSTVYDNDGLALDHYAHTRWTADGWIGISDPQTTVSHDTIYMRDSRLVPNYGKDGPSDTTLDGLYQSYMPLEKGNWTTAMGNAGYQPQIGLLPLWDALYINSGGDARAYKSVLANAETLNSYPIIWADPVSNQPIVVADWPTWTTGGAGGGGDYGYAAGDLAWELNHHPSGAYLAYLITGDYYHLETMQYHSALLYLSTTSGAGSGEARILGGETRGKAWTARTLGQLAGISPADPISDGLAGVLNSTINRWHEIVQTPDLNGLGYFSAYGATWPGFAHGDGQEAPWQQHFWMQSLGHIADLEALTDMSALIAVRDHLYQGVVGILGPNGEDSFCFNNGAAYAAKVSPVDDRTDPTLWYDTWGEVYTATYGTPNTSCGNSLSGSLLEAETSYWGNLLPAIAYAVEDGAPGAAESWTRLISAENFSVVENSGFEDIPVWGVWPRKIK